MWMLACEFTLIYSLTCLSLLRRALLLLPNAGEQGEGSGRGEKKTTPPPKKKKPQVVRVFSKGSILLCLVGKSSIACWVCGTGTVPVLLYAPVV